MGLCGVGERQRPGDDRPQRAGGKGRADASMSFAMLGRGHVPDRQAGDGRILAHQPAGQNLDRPAAADDDDAAAERNQLEIVRQVDVGEHLENHVGPALVGQPQNLVAVARGSVVQHVMCAFGGDQGPPAIAARRPDDGQAGGHRELDGREPDASTGAVDQHRLSRPRLRPLHEPPPCRDRRHTDRGPLLEGHMVRKAMHGVGRAHQLLGVAARGVRPERGDIHAIAGPHATHCLTDLLDDAGCVGARCVRQLRLARVRAGADIRVNRIHSGRRDTNAHVGRPRLRRRNVLDAEDLRPTERAHADGFHGHTG